MDDDRRSRFPVALIAGAVVLLPILYVFSIGPVGWLANHDYIEPNSAVGSMIQMVYAPLEIAASYCPPLRRFIEWYLERRFPLTNATASGA